MLTVPVFPAQGRLMPELEKLLLVNVVVVLLILAVVAVVTVVLVRRGMRRRVAEERLAAMGTATARILHQIKNPLQSIILHAEMLAEDRVVDADPALRREAGAAVVAAANEMVELVGDLSAYASGVTRSLSPEPVDLDALVREVARSQAALTERSGIAMHVEIGSSTLVHADAYFLRHALENVIGNARDALAEPGAATEPRLEIRLRHEGEEAVVEVRDNGPGIEEDPIDAVVQPFVTTKGRGMGLGLAICRDIVEAHGGELRLESTPGSGTTVMLTLPTVSPRRPLQPA